MTEEEDREYWLAYLERAPADLKTKLGEVAREHGVSTWRLASSIVRHWESRYEALGEPKEMLDDVFEAVIPEMGELNQIISNPDDHLSR